MKIKGISYGWNSKREEYMLPGAIDSLKKLKSTNAEWISLTFNVWQDNHYSTQIYFDFEDCMTDKDIEVAVKNAHLLGLKVCLKPVVNIKSNVWRGFIYFPEESAGKVFWDKWFDSYLYFIMHYAKIAEQLNCEMFCIGCELSYTESQSEYWINIINKVRNIYHGPIIYNANHGYELNIQWLSLLDYIGTSAYYPVGSLENNDKEYMCSMWEIYKSDMISVYEKFKKKIVFMEIGCCSSSGASCKPWLHPNYENSFDDIEQANFYESAFEAFWNEKWFGGMFWWDWATTLLKLEESVTKPDFSIYGKKSEQIVRKWYKKK